MRAPASVRVLGRTYKVTCENEPTRAGYCDNRAGVLNVMPDQDEFSLRDTLLHECMHALLYQQGSTHAYKLEEKFVRPLATGLMTLFQDNPALVKTLFSPVAPK